MTIGGQIDALLMAHFTDARLSESDAERLRELGRKIEAGELLTRAEKRFVQALMRTKMSD